MPQYTRAVRGLRREAGAGAEVEAEAEAEAAALAVFEDAEAAGRDRLTVAEEPADVPADRAATGAGGELADGGGTGFAVETRGDAKGGAVGIAGGSVEGGGTGVAGV